MTDANENTVYLVGAGPGDPGLITIRARELLENADTVIYDYLASEAVMRFVPATAQKIFVGKKGFSAHVTQDQINDCLVDNAREGAGRSIVRLKGGDPFVFGRGGEEALALRDAGIRFEVMPGITAGVAACAYAGIPVTHRTLASSVTLITGHETPDKASSTIDWAHLARGTDTICFYMGIRDLPLISQRLTENGRPASTPVALIRWGTTPHQEVLCGTLADIAQRAEKAAFKAPAIIVVGQVVSLRDKLKWFEDRPLLGKTVVVTRTRAQASDLSAKLRRAGAEVVEFPTIEIRPRTIAFAAPAAAQDIRRAIEHLGSYNWVVFTSANGVKCFFAMLDELHLDARAFAGAKIAAIGSATAAALQRTGLRADAVPQQFVAESAAKMLIDEGVGAGSSVLIPRASVARNTLPELLREAGATVDVLPVYDTVEPEIDNQSVLNLVDRLREGSVDAVTFTSSSTARNFASILDKACAAVASDSGTSGLASRPSNGFVPTDDSAVHEGSTMPSPSELLSGVKCASIGPITSKTMEACGLSVAVQAETYTIDGLMEALGSLLAG